VTEVEVLTSHESAEGSAVVQAFGRVPLIAIVRHSDSSHTAQALNALADGGVVLAEVTSSTPGWLDLIASANARLTAGAGTITNVGQVIESAQAGARFIVSPGFDRDVVRAALDRGLEPIPGVLTPTEIMDAHSAGVRFMKLFPAGPMGMEYFRALRAPFSHLSFVPTGGIGVDQIANWMAAGAAGVALGSELAGRAGPIGEDERTQMSERARLAVSAVSSKQSDGEPRA
jgi:2-dehydro-3-deoxyphosphogluconate aldolase/(4S)-4-hydroxy-2-oxoglutarate aldolase